MCVNTSLFIIRSVNVPWKQKKINCFINIKLIWLVLVYSSFLSTLLSYPLIHVYECHAVNKYPSLCFIHCSQTHTVPNKLSVQTDVRFVVTTIDSYPKLSNLQRGGIGDQINLINVISCKWKMQISRLWDIYMGATLSHCDINVSASVNIEWFECIHSEYWFNSQLV